MDVSSPDDPFFPVHRCKDVSVIPLPNWIKNDARVTLNVDGINRIGNLHLSDNVLWSFVTRDRRGGIEFCHPLHDLPHTWHARFSDGSLMKGWPAGHGPDQFRAHKVSAKGLQRDAVPSSFRQSMKTTHPDHKLWKLSCCEECEGFQNQNTHRLITRKYYCDRCSQTPTLPTMCVQTVKHDEHGAPDRVKSHIVALGNHEEDAWSKSDRFAPVIGQAKHCPLTSVAAEMGRKQKQGDCKNAFLHPRLPEDEVVIFRPLSGCPHSTSDDLWSPQKTIHGLRRSPFHWCQSITGAFKQLGLAPLPNAPCICTGTLVANEPPVFVGLHVNDFTHFSASDATERAFEQRLSQEIDVEFMGPVAWFLGCLHTWDTLPDGRLTVHISQTAKIESLLDQFNMTNCNPCPNAFRSVHPIDRIPPDGINASQKLRLMKRHQSLVGGLNWIAISTHPEITTAVQSSARHLIEPTEQHFEAAKRVLRWLQGVHDCGIRFTQNEAFAAGIAA